MGLAPGGGGGDPWPVRLRLIAVTSLGLLLSLAAVAFGGIPLLAGLVALALLATVLLPARSRRYLLQRLARITATVVVAMALVWILVHNYPDASRTDATGLVPALIHYVAWLGDVVAGDLGGTTSYSETVGQGVSRTVPISLQLLAYSQVMAIALAVPGAVLGARYRGRLPDLGARAVGILGLTVPLFVTGVLLAQLLGVGDVNLGGIHIGFALLPTGRYIPLGDGIVPHVRSMLLPSLTLALGTAATYLVLLRSELLGQLTLDHVLLARSKGLPPGRIITRHALRPAAPSAVAAIAAQSAAMLGNVVIIEHIFLLPGFGDYVLVAVGRRDELAVVGGLFVAAAILAVVNLLADAALIAIDPRLEP